MCLGSLRSLSGHVWKSIRYYRRFAVYFVAGVVLATSHTPIIVSFPEATLSVYQGAANQVPQRTPIPARFRLDIGEPPASIFHIARIIIAGWFAFWGVFWDVQKRAKEWALIRLYGGHPSLVAGFQYFCLTLLGALIGGGFALLIGPTRYLSDTAWLMSATLIWAFLFSCCVSIGPIIYAEFCDTIAVFRVEG